MWIEYTTRTKRQHANGGKEHGWTKADHEAAMLKEMGKIGWILCAIKPQPDCSSDKYYFHYVHGE